MDARVHALMRNGNPLRGDSKKKTGRRKVSMTKMLSVVVGGLLFMSLSMSVFQTVAAPAIASYPVTLQGNGVVQLRGELKGPDNSTRDYVVHVGKGETLSVALDSDKTSVTYFNVMQQGHEEALFVGERQDERKWQQQVQEEGDYVIRLYINRAAARRGESSRYTLSVSAF